MSPAWDVLVVEDEPVVREAICRVLEHHGLRVAEASDGVAALLHPALHECRLVLCDLMLPGRSGFEVVSEIRRRRPEIPVVAITGCPTAENQSRASQAGATAFLAKPFDVGELLEWTPRVLPRMSIAAEEEKS